MGMQLLPRVVHLSFVSLIWLIFTACSPISELEAADANYEVPEGFKTVVVGAGCFWCVEAFFEAQPGVTEAISGYAGGFEENPTCRQVAGGVTTHAEVVKVVYNPEETDLRTLIDFFWTTHDVSRDDGVWPDFGPQYRSILLYADESKKEIFEASMKAYSEYSGVKVATEISALDKFYTAEKYHQDFAELNPRHRYIVNILNPKLKKLGIE